MLVADGVDVVSMDVADFPRPDEKIETFCLWYVYECGAASDECPRAVLRDRVNLFQLQASHTGVCGIKIGRTAQSRPRSEDIAFSEFLFRTTIPFVLSLDI